MISLVLAMSRNRVIGRDNRLPWSLPADLKHFRALTMGKPIVMGRKTYESIGKPLPGRHNIVVTRNRDFEAEGVTVAHDVEDALVKAGAAPEVMIVGGAEIYRAALPLAGRIYLTRIDADFDGDTFFPKLDPADWTEADAREGAIDERNPLAHRFIELVRRS